MNTGTAMLVVSREELEQIVEAAVARAVRAANTQQETEILTRDQAAALLQVHPAVVVRYVRTQGLPGVKLGPEWRFRRSEIEEWLRAQAVKPGGHTEHQGRKLRAAKGGE